MKVYIVTVEQYFGDGHFVVIGGFTDYDAAKACAAGHSNTHIYVAEGEDVDEVRDGR